jgi:hypothetical protein
LLPAFVIFPAAVTIPQPLAWFAFIDREKMLVARSTAIPKGVNFTLDIAFVSIYPNNLLAITFGVVAALAVFGDRSIVHIYVRVIQ